MTIDHGRIFAVGVYGGIFALDAGTGKVLWTGHEPTTTADLSSANGVLYVLNTSDQLYAYRESGCGSPTCAPLAVIDDPTPARGVSIFPPVIAGGYVLYVNSNGLRALTVS
jgi:outer membrane protein assembly factor BamB